MFQDSHFEKKIGRMPLHLHSSLSVKIIAYNLTFINVGTSAKYQPGIISRGRKKRYMKIIVVIDVLKLFSRQSPGTSLNAWSAMTVYLRFQTIFILNIIIPLELIK